MYAKAGIFTAKIKQKTSTLAEYPTPISKITHAT